MKNKLRCKKENKSWETPPRLKENKNPKWPQLVKKTINGTQI